MTCGFKKLSLDDVVEPETETEATPASRRPRLFEPFPTDALPYALESFVTATSESVGCDPTMIVLPLLSALGAAIGTSRVVQLKPGWREPSIVWSAVVADSGTGKSPAQRVALQPVKCREAKAFKERREEGKRWRAAMLEHEVALRNWKAKKTDRGAPPDPPEQKLVQRFLVGDVTIEALAPVLQGSPRGVLVARDELAGLIRGFDRYSGGAGEAAQWLELWNGGTLQVDRKTSDPILISRAAVSVTGAVQIDALRRALGRELVENGFAARVLIAMPPRRQRRWTEQTIASEVVDALEGVFLRLWELSPH